MVLRNIFFLSIFLIAGCRTTQQVALQGSEREPAIVITASGQLLVNNKLEEINKLGKRVKKAGIPKETPIYIQIQGEPTDSLTQRKMKDVSTQIKSIAKHSRFFFVTEREATSEVLQAGQKIEIGTTTLNEAAPPAGTPAGSVRGTPTRNTAPLGSAANPRRAAPRKSRYAR